MKGSLLALAGFFCMAVFGIFTRTAYQHGGAIWVSEITYIVGSLACWPLIAISGGGKSLQSSQYGKLFARAAFGCTASFLYTLSLRDIPIVNATLLFNAAPIFIPILAVVWLKIPVLRSAWIAVMLGFVGITIIVKPSSDILHEPSNLIALASGMSLAVAYVLIKLLTATETRIRIVFYYLFVSSILQLPLLLVAGPVPEVECWLWSSAAGGMLFLAQLGLVQAYRYAEVQQVGVYQYASVVFVGLIEWVLGGPTPSISELFGVILVVIAGIVIIRTSQEPTVPHINKGTA